MIQQRKVLILKWNALVSKESKSKGRNNAAAHKALLYTDLINNMGCMQYRDGHNHTSKIKGKHIT